MRLCDKHIKEYLQEGKIKIEPAPNESTIHGASVDLTLGNGFISFQQENVPFINLAGDKEELSHQLDLITGPEKILKEDEYFYLHPGNLALGTTEQVITLPSNMLAWLDGRSSLARLGLMVHVTAHRIDPGWSGKIVLEFYNAGQVPLALKPGMTIGAVSFELLSGEAESPYLKRTDSKYKHQASTLASKIFKEN